MLNATFLAIFKHCGGGGHPDYACSHTHPCLTEKQQSHFCVEGQRFAWSAWSVTHSALHHPPKNFANYLITVLKNHIKMSHLEFQTFQNSHISSNIWIFEPKLIRTKCNFDIYKCIFETYKCNFEIYKSNFEIYKSNFEIYKCIFEIYKCNFEIYKCNFEIYKVNNIKLSFFGSFPLCTYNRYCRVSR